jgi:N-acetylneuraminic acid mutarotase
MVAAMTAFHKFVKKEKPGIRFGGQSLVEILIAAGIGMLLVIAAVSIIAPALKTNTAAMQAQIVAALSKELSDNIRSWAQGNWNSVLALATSSANHYYLNTSVSPFAAVYGDEVVTVGSLTYKRYFSVDDMYRDSAGMATTTAAGNAIDPSTKKITLTSGALSGGAHAYTGALNAWTSTTPLPTAVFHNSVAVNNGYVYSISGGLGAGALTSTVNYAPIRSDASVGAWSVTVPLPTAIYGQSSFAYNHQYVYTIGGRIDQNNPTTTVLYAPTNPDGSLGNWSSTAKLPQATSHFARAVNNGYVYVIGGDIGNSTATAAVWFAPINSTGSIGAWSSTTALPLVDENGAAAAYNGFLYLIGGNGNGGNPISYYAPINSTGSLGSWLTATSTCNCAWSSATAVANNGYLYQIGGDLLAATSTIFYTSIQSDGSLNAWSQTTPLPGPLESFSSVLYNGYVYTVGGSTVQGGGSATSTVQYALFTVPTSTTITQTASFYLTRSQDNVFVQSDWSGGPGQSGPSTKTNNKFSASAGISYATTTKVLVLAPSGNLSSWAATTALPKNVFAHQSVVSNNYAYSIGGQIPGESNPTSTVWFAPINSTGSISAWSSTTPLPNGLKFYSSIANNNYAYAIGGFDGNANTSTVFYASLNSTGSISNWSSTSKLPSAIRGHMSVVNNNYVYVIGGWSDVDGAATSTVWFAPINSTGSLGAWSSTAALPKYDYSGATAVWNGYVYLLGGSNNGNTQVAYYAPFNSTGSLGAWLTATSTCLCTWIDATAAANNGYLYQFGGYSGGTTSTVFYTSINSTGSLNAWSQTTALPGAIAIHSTIVNNGYVYTIAGSPDDGSAGTTTVQYAQFNTTYNAIGTLDSTTYDTGVAGGAELNSIIWQGSQPAGTSVSFQLAVSNSSGGPWNFIGPDGTASTYFSVNPGVSIPLVHTDKTIGYSIFSGYRYFRYRATLQSNPAQTLSPLVNNVIVNWSP